MKSKYKLKNEHNVDGYIVFIGNVEIISQAFSFRQIIIEVEAGGYTQEIAFDFVNDKIFLSSGYALRDHVHIVFQLTGRGKIGDKGKKKWYVNLQAVNISKI